MIRSARQGSWLFVVAAAVVSCATGVSPDTYSGVGYDVGGGGSVDAAIEAQPDAASAGAQAEGGAGGRVPDAAAQDTGTAAWQPDAVAGGDAPASADTGPDTSSDEASVDAMEPDAGDDDADADGGGTDEGGNGSESGVVCDRHTCSGGCCDTSGVCQTQPSADNCPTSFHSGGRCEDCKAEGENYCVFELIAYVCSSTP